jgi:thioesterase domain-containing protein
MLFIHIDQTQALNWFNMYKHHNKLVGLYKPPCSVNSKMLFFKPAEKIPFDDQMGKPMEKWKPFARQGMDIIEAPGNHFTMISPANTAVLAGEIKKYLDEHISFFN